jgi:hypothetical protein
MSVPLLGRVHLDYFEAVKSILRVETVEILRPEVNMRSSHNTKTISIQICSIAREDVP